MPTWTLAVLVVLLALAVNVPLGYLRQGARRFSVAWFAWIHLSIPLIVALRTHHGLGLALVPGTVAGAVAGQMLGGRARRVIDARRNAARARLASGR